MFQSTRLRWTRRGRRGTDAPTCGFNPRVREGRDAVVRKIDEDAVVSIHASTRDATALAVYAEQVGNVSIHASARDATRSPRMTQMTGWFQSTRPRGTRRGIGSEEADPAGVSIHASARDATWILVSNQEAIMFQSTRPRGTRRHSKTHSHVPSVSIHASARDATDVRHLEDLLDQFQSTRPRGTRRMAGCST